MGERCSNCTVGYYGFSSEFPDTCLKCHCTGKTSDCDMAPGYYIVFVNTTFSTRRDNNLLEGWKSVDENGVNAGKGSWNWAPEYSIERYVGLNGKVSLSEKVSRKLNNILYSF